MAVKNVKTCPNCKKNNTKKIGKRLGLQRYKCNACDTKFQLKRRPEKLQEIIFKKIYLQETNFKRFSRGI